MMEMVWVAIVSTVGGLIGLLIYQRGNLTNWALRMDYKQAEYAHKEKMEDIKKKAQQKMLSLKQNTPKEAGGLLETLSGLDVDKVEGIIDKVTDLAEGTGEDSFLGSLLPLAKGVIKGIGGKKKEDQEEEELIR
jgi:hypothetical protein